MILYKSYLYIIQLFQIMEKCKGRFLLFFNSNCYLSKRKGRHVWIQTSIKMSDLQSSAHSGYISDPYKLKSVKKPNNFSHPIKHDAAFYIINFTITNSLIIILSILSRIRMQSTLLTIQYRHITLSKKQRKHAQKSFGTQYNFSMVINSIKFYAINVKIKKSYRIGNV